jgi:hypothetical protein
MAVDFVSRMLHYPVDRVVVVELDEPESAFPVGGFVDQVFGAHDVAELAEVFFERFVVDVVLQAADEDFLYGLAGLSLSGVLSGRGSLRLNLCNER